jgi:hypothetical protein
MDVIDCFFYGECPVPWAWMTIAAVNNEVHGNIFKMNSLVYDNKTTFVNLTMI